MRDQSFEFIWLLLFNFHCGALHSYRVAPRTSPHHHVGIGKRNASYHLPLQKKQIKWNAFERIYIWHKVNIIPMFARAVIKNKIFRAFFIPACAFSQRQCTVSNVYCILPLSLCRLALEWKTNHAHIQNIQHFIIVGEHSRLIFGARLKALWIVIIAMFVICEFYDFLLSIG